MRKCLTSTADFCIISTVLNFRRKEFPAMGGQILIGEVSEGHAENISTEKAPA